MQKPCYLCGELTGDRSGVHNSTCRADAFVMANSAKWLARNGILRQMYDTYRTWKAHHEIEHSISDIYCTNDYGDVIGLSFRVSRTEPARPAKRARTSVTSHDTFAVTFLGRASSFVSDSERPILTHQLILYSVARCKEHYHGPVDSNDDKVVIGFDEEHDEDWLLNALAAVRVACDKLQASGKQILGDYIGKDESSDEDYSDGEGSREVGSDGDGSYEEGSDGEVRPKACAFKFDYCSYVMEMTDWVRRMLQAAAP